MCTVAENVNPSLHVLKESGLEGVRGEEDWAILSSDK